MKKIEDINFDSIDLSEYSDEIQELEKDFDAIKKNRRLMRILNKYEKKLKKDELKITYNSSANNQNFKSIKIGKEKAITRKENYDSESSFFSGETKNILPFC